MFGSDSSSSLPQIPQAPPPPPMFGASPAQGQKPKQKSSQAQETFIGSAGIPAIGQTGGKTLLGQ